MEILKQNFQEWNAAAIANRFLGLLHSSKFEEGIAPRGFPRHAGAEIVRDVHFKMARQFCLQFAIEPFFAEKIT